MAAFQLVGSDNGFSSGLDKKFNEAFGSYLRESGSIAGEIVVEKGLDGLPIIPDVAWKEDHRVSTLEFHWRSGDHLVSANRSDIAQYILRKLKDYAVALGWVPS